MDPTQKHCNVHDHYQTDCFQCKQAYARFKAGIAALSSIVPTVIKKPGKPFDISEMEGMEELYFTPPIEIVDNTDGPSSPKPMPSELSKLSVPELRKLCSKQGITQINGMPTSNCRRDQLIGALMNENGFGTPENGASNFPEGEGKGEAGKEYGPKEGKAPPIPIPPPMVPFADAILKSQEFEDAVRGADVLGDVRADMNEARRIGLDAMNGVAAANQQIEKLKQQGGGTMNIVVVSKPDLPMPNPTGEIPNSPILKRIIEHLSNREHVALVGPAGSGKSTLVRLACKALDAEMYHTPCGGDIREQHLLGRTIPIQGEWTYIPAPFVQAFESEGFSVALLDEMDGVSDPSTLLPINDVLAGFDKLHLPWRWNSPYATRGKGFLGVAATMNTIGAGATSMYQGRTALDGSTLDRFVGRIIIVPYDANYEKAYIAGPEGSEACPSGTELYTFITDIRSKAEANNLRRIISTRMLQQGVAMLRRGWKFRDVKEALLTGWSPDDRRMCGV